MHLRLKKSKLLIWFGLCLLIFSVLIGLAALIFYPKLKQHYEVAQRYDLNDLSKYNETSIFYDETDQEIGRLAVENRIVLKHREIPDLMRQAIIAAEDRRFYWHYGIDLIGIARAIYINLKTGKFIQGGSTITQQLAKNALGMFERSLDRKFVETFLALRIENHFSKEEILDYYINRIYFGKGYFGLEAAARGYFGKSAQSLTLGECAMLAGLIRSPNSSSPRRNYANALQGRDRVLENMMREKFITREQAKEAKQKRIRLIPETAVGLNKYFTPLVLQELQEVLNFEENEFPQGLRVYTTLNASMQNTAERSLSETLSQVEWELSHKETPNLNRERKDPLQGSVLVLDAASGGVRAYVGGRDFVQSQFDRVTVAQRDNGPLLYPFIYALTMEKLGWHPASLIDSSFIDKPELKTAKDISFGNPNQDLRRRFFILQEALAGAYKSAAIRATFRLGLPTLANWLERTGINLPDMPKRFQDLKPLTLWEMTSLYQIFANQGVQQKPFFIRAIRDRKGSLLYRHPTSAGVAQLSSQVAQQMTLTLNQVIRDKGFQKDIFPSLAGFSSYSDGQRDAWFLGYTPRWVTGIWVGYDPSIPIGNKTIVAKTAIPLGQNIISSLPRATNTFTPTPNFIKLEAEKNTGFIQGLSGFSPSPGNATVYLTQDQLLNNNSLSPQLNHVSLTEDWSNWLYTLYANPSEFFISNPTKLNEISEIPPVVEYVMPPLRGDIVSANDSPLAVTLQSQSLVLPWPDLETASTIDAALDWIKPKLKLATNWLEKSVPFSEDELRSRYRWQRFNPVPIYDRLSSEQVTAFSTSDLSQQGFVLQTFPQRFYPEGNVLAHTLGYLQRTKARRDGAYQAGEVIYDQYKGAEGLEKSFDAELTGSPGKFIIATTSDGFTQRSIIEKKATVGLNLRTTFDLPLQKAVEASLTNVSSGAIVIMNVTNGDVVAMASQPTFNPNDFLPTLAPEKWQSFLNAEDNPLQHRAFRQFNPPGSTFKIITTLASLYAGTFDPNRVVQGKGYYQIGNVRFNLPKETYPVSFRSAFAQSINTYFIDLGLRTGRKAIIEAATAFGLGQPTGISLSRELAGLMPTPEYIREKYARIMGQGDIANVSIGQGDVLATPLQMANGMAALANGGTLFRPRLVTEFYNREGQIVKTIPPEILHTLPLTPEQFQIIKEAMISVTEEGTGHRAQVPGLKIAGKTGTAQVGSKIKPRQVAWFVGFLPADRPYYSFAIMIEGKFEESLSGGADAASLISKIFKDYKG